MTNFHFPVIRCARPAQARPDQALGGLIQRSGDACGLVSKMVSYWTGMQRKSVSCQHTIHPACSLPKALLLWLLRRTIPTRPASWLPVALSHWLKGFLSPLPFPPQFPSTLLATPLQECGLAIMYGCFLVRLIGFFSFFLPWGSFEVQGNK